MYASMVQMVPHLLGRLLELGVAGSLGVEADGGLASEDLAAFAALDRLRGISTVRSLDILLQPGRRTLRSS